MAEADTGAGAEGPLPLAFDVAARRELVAWSVLGISALAIAGAFALLLAMSRVPGIATVLPWPINFFGKGLVIHVVFSFVVWFLAAFATLAAAVMAGPVAASAAAGPRQGARLMLVPPLMAGVGLPLLFIPALRDQGDATLNNYIPVIIDPLYYAGLLLVAGAIAAPALRLVLSLRRKASRTNPTAVAMALAALAYLAALAAFAIAWSGLAETSPDYAFNEYLMWGGGHLLQFANTILVVVAWAVLARLAAGDDPVIGFFSAAVSAVLAAISVLGLLIYAVYPPFSGPQMEAFTWLQYALGPAALVMIGALALRMGSRRGGSHPALQCLWLSVLVFTVGGFLGLFVDGTDTRTPAHYHGVIAGVSLALMGAFFFLVLPMLDRPVPSSRRCNWTFRLFGWGQLTACIGLFVAGGHGAPRKVAGEAQGLADMAAYAGMAVNGIGALIAIVGGVLFVWTVAAALVRASDAEKDSVRPRPAL